MHWIIAGLGLVIITVNLLAARAFLRWISQRRSPLAVEDQRSISMWAQRTFGSVLPRAAYNRMCSEVVELGEALDVDDLKKARGECADVLITLYRLCDVLEGDLHRSADEKMVVNRRRHWRLNGDGTGQHVTPYPCCRCGLPRNSLAQHLDGCEGA